MKKHRPHGLALTAAALLTAAVAPLSASTLVHRYSFNTDNKVEDTATGGTTGGPANLVNGTIVGTAVVTGGTLFTDSEADGTAYASIPGAATAGLTGSFTIQQFATPIFQAGFYQTLSVFTLPGGDNNGGTQNNILISSPVRYQNNFPSGFDYWQTGVNGGNQWLVLGPPGDSGSLQHVFTTTYDAATGIARYYYDGLLTDASPEGALTGFNLSLLSNIGINGRSPFNDASLTGTTNEFRIYEGVLTDEQVALTSADADLTAADFENAGISVPVSGTVAAVLKITASSFDFAAHKARLTFTSVSGKNYRVTKSADLKTWAQVGANVPATAASTTAEVSFTTATAGFFRVEEVQ